MTSLKVTPVEGELAELGLPGQVVKEGPVQHEGVQLYSLRAYGVKPWLFWVQDIRVLDAWHLRVIPSYVMVYLVVGVLAAVAAYAAQVMLGKKNQARL